MSAVPEEISGVFEPYAPGVRKPLLELRRLILRVAKSKSRIGPIAEAVRWGQASFLTTASRSGSTIRIDGLRSRPGWYAMYFHCQTTLVSSFRQKFGATLKYEGNRALLFSSNEALPMAIVGECVRDALTYYVARRGPHVSVGRQIKSQPSL